MQRLRKKLYHIIFLTDTPAGKRFDIILLAAILLNTIAVMLESVQGIKNQYGNELKILEWIFTILFIIEYFLRIWTSKKPIQYIFSFYGVVDLFAILPLFMEMFLIGSHSLVIIRSLRLLRLFRIFKLSRHLNQGNIIVQALKESWAKVSVFLFGVITIILVVGTVMYMVESPESGFTSIPRSIYWTIVTVTTVGFGDITPQTTLGQIIASFTMILGYAIIAVPTGIVTVEMSKKTNLKRVCSHCQKIGHENDALFCKHCGKALDAHDYQENNLT